ncbi:MAG: extracellular solute-binding protein [Kineothrix sp.]
MWKKINIFAVLILITLLCGGCGSKGVYGDQPVSITIWHVYGAQTDSPLNDLIDVFNETTGKEKGIRVEVTMVSNNKNIYKDILAAANGSPGAPELPDIFVSYPKTVFAMPDENILVDYRDYFSEEELSDFVPEFLQEGVVNGRLVILPVAKSTELMYVNKTAFDRFADATGARLEELSTWEGIYDMACDYAAWTDGQTPDTPGDGKAFFVHDFPFNYFQVGVESLGESFFEGEQPAFGPMFRRVWEPYAKAAVSGGIWLQGGYATEPLRTGEAIVSVASSASVLYFSDVVTYADNTSEEVELLVLPCPVFEDGSRTVMGRGAGMCTVKSTPEREQAAITFLKWLTEPECNARFAVSAGYMPSTQEAFDVYMPQEISKLTEQKYIELYKAFTETQSGYTFYVSPQFEGYQDLEADFDKNVSLCLLGGKNDYMEAGGNDDRLLEQLIWENYQQLKSILLK